MTLGHWPFILAAAVAPVLIGALWYSPLMFAKAWVRAHGYSAEKLAALQANAGRAYAGSFLAFVVIAFVLHIFLSHLGADSFWSGAGWGFHVWVGFALPIGFAATLHSEKPLMTFGIDTGYHLVYLTTMGAILGGWA